MRVTVQMCVAVPPCERIVLCLIALFEHRYIWSSPRVDFLISAWLLAQTFGHSAGERGKRCVLLLLLVP
jgi:hypothetical protein